MVRFSTLILSIVFSILLIPCLALAHFDAEGDLEMTCESTANKGDDLTDPEETKVRWWWCYSNDEFEELTTTEPDPKFSLSMQVDVIEEGNPENVLASCSGELSTKDFGSLVDFCGPESECTLDSGSAGHDCHVEEVAFEEAGLDINDVIPGLGDCEVVLEAASDPEVVFTGDIKALHNAAVGDNNGRRDTPGGQGNHDKDIEVCS